MRQQTSYFSTNIYSPDKISGVLCSFDYFLLPSISGCPKNPRNSHQNALTEIFYLYHEVGHVFLRGCTEFETDRFICSVRKKMSTVVRHYVLHSPKTKKLGSCLYKKGYVVLRSMRN